MERVLAVAASAAEQHRRGGVADGVAVAVDPFAVRFHFELLQIIGQQIEALCIRQHGV